MRVATWNVNGLNARLAFALHWLGARSPDLVALQEIKMTDEQFPHLAFEAAGYHALTHGQKAWNGVAILARDELQLVERGLPGQEDLGARFLHARAGGLDFVTVYCPNGKHLGHEDFPRKLAWLDALAEHLAQTLEPTRPAIVGGDFNVCPSGLDTWDEAGHEGAIFHTEDERRRFQRLLDAGLVDAFRALYPDRRAFSWWDYRGGAFHKQQGLRIDFLLATAPAMKRIASVEIDRDYRKKKEGLVASDHAPVIAELASS